MPRPIRIEYENAYYHVMNRGGGRRTLFHNESYFEAFLKTLGEAHQRFAVQVLSYCLMSNHYHLLLKTPEANLGRAMRHINGVYTQRHNRMKKTDGSLFRGRYKAICIEEDSYQLQLSRYIHRNPIEAKLVDNLEEYPWSSYSYFINHKKAPEWLYLDEIYQQVGGVSNKRNRYKEFVELGVDEEIKQFYSKEDSLPYLGSDDFRQWVYQQRETDTLSVSKKELRSFRPKVEKIIYHVADLFRVEITSITKTKRGRVPDNIPRWVALYLARECSGCLLKEIADNFGLKKVGSISTTINKLQGLMATDKKLARKVTAIRSRYDT
ncbi:MAG: transposase [Cycloclasticus sp.]